ncbi:MAG: reverse transcriptase/maturase family protein [Elusimicrobiota bacterium]|nr:reverse transcriptase/maturase family protein [Elusimicrobiota bacterium]
MKTYKGLYERLVTFENLHSAFRKAAKGKGLRADCAAFAYGREREILLLQEELTCGTYRHGPYREFTVSDPKKREVKAARFRDRVVHHALCNVIEPIFEARFLPESFACRKGKGTLAALSACRREVRRMPGGYVLKADVSKFFHTVDHRVLLDLLGRKIADEKVMRLCALILASSEDSRFRTYFPGDDLFACGRPTGIPIGNLTSQLFANVYLHELDCFVKTELRRGAYLRYMDDFLIFGPEKPDLWRAFARVEDFMAEKLRLRLHPVKRTVSPVHDGVDWVGYRVFPAAGRGLPDRVRLRRRNIFRFRERCAGLRRRYRAGSIPLEAVRDSIVSFLGYTRQAQAGRLM